jgi:hypothetical protein
MIRHEAWKKSGVFLICALITATGLFSQSLPTPAENSHFSRYSQDEEIALFLSELAYLSPVLKIQVIGQSYGSRQYGAKDLLLCILTENGIDCPEKLDRNKPTLLLMASQHGNEQSAKEASLRMIRDLAVGELKTLLHRLNVLVLPQTNPYGNFYDQRRNAQDLDLNRDHVKLEAPEVRAIHRVFRDWIPEITLDVHEKGDDYYRVSIGCVSNANIHADIQNYSRQVILAEVERDLTAKNISFFEYLVTQRMGIDSSAGVDYRPEDRGRDETMKRYSTTDLNDGRNSLGIYETFSFIQEGASRHDLLTLEERTTWQYFGIRFFSLSVALHGREILALVNKLRSELEAKAGTYSEDDLVHLRMKYARQPSQPTLAIKSFERSLSPVRGILKVDKKAGDPLTAADITPYPYAPEYSVKEEAVSNWFPNVEPTVSVVRPQGYILQAGQRDIVQTLFDHGIAVDVFTKDLHLEVEAYQVADILPAAYDYLPPQEIIIEKKGWKTVIKKGDFYVSCAQPAANLIPCLLEPESQYGLIRYWKYKLVPSKSDVFPIYRVPVSDGLPVIPYKNWKK